MELQFEFSGLCVALDGDGATAYLLNSDGHRPRMYVPAATISPQFYRQSEAVAKLGGYGVAVPGGVYYAELDISGSTFLPPPGTTRTVVSNPGDLDTALNLRDFYADPVWSNATTTIHLPGGTFRGLPPLEDADQKALWKVSYEEQGKQVTHKQALVDRLGLQVTVEGQSSFTFSLKSGPTTAALTFQAYDSDPDRPVVIGVSAHCARPANLDPTIVEDLKIYRGLFRSVTSKTSPRITDAGAAVTFGRPICPGTYYKA
jgi:hypothetical protein